MYRTFIITIVVLTFLNGCDNTKTAIINGSLDNVTDKSISISIGSDPRTLLKTKENASKIDILEDGSFSYSIDFNSPIWLTFISDNAQFVSYVFIMHPGETQIAADCSKSFETIEYSGVNGPLNSFYRKWNRLYNGILRELKSNELAYEDWVFNLDSIETVFSEMLLEFKKEKPLKKDELYWLSSRIKHSKYSTLLSRAYRSGSKPEDNDFDFFEKLDLNDEKACKIDQRYNRLIHRYVLHQVNSDGVFYVPAGDNTQFHELMYNTALKKLSGEVRDVVLNILVSDLLSKNETAAPEYYERFLNDCNSKDLLEMTRHLYDEYLALATKELDHEVVRIQTENHSPMEVLSKFENKVLYLDFWASWCSPCINSIPMTIKLANHFQDKDVEVLYIGHNDQENNLESAIKKHEISGKHLILNQEETEVWRKEFNVEGIPSYVLLDRNHKVVEFHAPHPDDQLIYTMIDSLLLE